MLLLSQFLTSVYLLFLCYETPHLELSTRLPKIRFPSSLLLSYLGSDRYNVGRKKESEPFADADAMAGAWAAMLDNSLILSLIDSP